MSEKKYLTIEETAEYLQCNRATVYNRMSVLKIKTVKFSGNRRAYLAFADVERMKQLEEAPWETEETKGDDGKDAA